MLISALFRVFGKLVMKIITKGLLLLTGTLMLAAPVSADVSLNSARVTAPDVLGTVDFYMAAFGMKEVQRISMQGGNLEIMLNFGATEQQALANTNAQVVIMHRADNEVADEIPHLIFNVTDIDKTVAAAKSAGGKVGTEPFVFGNTGIKIAMLIDPAGNHIELLQQP